jgi:hypothetical protein
MSFTSIVQILKVNEKRSGEKNGRRWEMQDAECALLNEKGDVEQVGVLVLPKDLTDKTVPGIYSGAFALKADTSREGQRRINAVLTGLTPLPPKAVAKGA